MSTSTKTSEWAEIKKRASQLGVTTESSRKDASNRTTSPTTSEWTQQWTGFENLTKSQRKQILGIVNSGRTQTSKPNHKSQPSRGSSFSGSNYPSGSGFEKILKQNESYKAVIKQQNRMINTLVLALSGKISVPAEFRSFSK